MKKKPFSLVYQILQECIFKCSFCNRRFEQGERRLTEKQRETMIDILAEKGLKRLTVTGGEPMMIKEEVTNLLEYTHFKEIHTCLSTTGYSFTKQYLYQLNNFLDHMLISVPTLDKNEWQFFFGSKKYSVNLYENVINILEWSKNTNIILEVCTVAQRNNLHKVSGIGNQLASINKNIIWRIEYYYPMGIRHHLRNLFEISKDEILELHKNISTNFENVFKDLYLSLPNRENAPDFFIAPNGDLVQTANNSYSHSYGNILDADLEIDFEMRRSWESYKKYCRDWK